MTNELEIKQFKAENQALCEQPASHDTLITHLVERLQILEARLAQDRHNSSKPPSSDSNDFKRSLTPKKRSLRTTSGNKPGDQTGHSGQALARLVSSEVEHFVIYRPKSVGISHYFFFS